MRKCAGIAAAGCADVAGGGEAELSVLVEAGDFAVEDEPSLVQAIRNMNFLEAAVFLGIPTSWTSLEPLRSKPLVPYHDLKNRDLPR
ncbi:hypothetical protein [Streptomyces sp. NPDC048473]|uniref:hypothetical protein n=1 Tax=unclassified Streptomyces TaxID=2593676 RepID=UPI00370FD4C2